MKKGISQESLKILACVTMLIDHVGATLVLQSCLEGQVSFGVYECFRMIGRLSFPIFAFLLAEGSAHTSNPRGYALRLLLAAVLSELPFDLAFSGRVYWLSQNVMLSLLMGLLALELMKLCTGPGMKLLAVLPFALAAEWMHTDYGASGVFLMAMFALTRELPHRHLVQGVCMVLIFAGMSSVGLSWTELISMQTLGALAIIPICLYSGEKKSRSKALQWGFYLFYPVHLTLLWLLMLVL